MKRNILKAQFFSCLILLVLLQPAFANKRPGQPTTPNQDDSPAPGASENGVVLPAPLGGFIPQLTLPTEYERQANVFTGSLGVNALYTDNAYTSGTKAVSDYQYSFLPSLGFQTFSEHTQLTLNYQGGVTLDQRLLSSSQQTHGAVVDLRHQFSHRLAAEFRQDFAMTNNPFFQIGSSASLPTITGPGELSNFAVPAPITRIGSITSTNVAYQLSQHSAMGASGSFSLQHFRDEATLVGSGGSLFDTTNAAGRAFYLRQISAHQTIGAEYQLQNLRFSGGIARTLDQTLYLFDGIAFHKDMSLALYVGPEQTHTHNVIVSLPSSAPVVLPLAADQWSVSGGLAYMWRTSRNGFRVSGDRGVSDGGLWAGAVRSNTARAEFQRTLNSRWTTTLRAGYSDGRVISVPSNIADNRITTEQGGIELLCHVTRNLAATAQYARIQQPHTGAFTSLLQNNHNQVQVGLMYQFQKVVSQ